MQSHRRTKIDGGCAVPREDVGQRARARPAPPPGAEPGPPAACSIAEAADRYGVAWPLNGGGTAETCGAFRRRSETGATSLHRDRFRQVARLVDVAAAVDRD